MSLRRVSVLALALLSALALSASAAFAQYPPASAFGVSCTNAAPGGTSQCTVVGAQANEQLAAAAAYGTTPFYTETLNANAEGEASFAFDVPAEAEGRTVTVTVVGAESGTASDTVAVAAVSDDDDDAIAGTPVSRTGTLPMTGGEVGILLALGIALLGGGLVALRRREDSKVAADA